MIGKDYDHPESNPYLERRERDNFNRLLDVINTKLQVNYNIGIMDFVPKRLEKK